MTLNIEETVEELKLSLAKMCRGAEEMLAAALDALQSRDAQAGAQVAQCDGAIDQAEADIERQCMRLLLRQQPFASDFRHVSAILKVITDIERIADQAGDVATLAGALSRDADLTPIMAMGRVALTMTRAATKAFLETDLAAARRVVAEDDRQDRLFEQTESEIAERIKDGTVAPRDALNGLMAAKYFERIGDHCVNIAEWTEFYEKGVHTKL